MSLLGFSPFPDQSFFLRALGKSFSLVRQQKISPQIDLASVVQVEADHASFASARPQSSLALKNKFTLKG